MPPYDRDGNGAAAEDLLAWRGRDWESVQRLASQAARAEAVGLGHGVSLTSPHSNARLSRDPTDAVTAMRSSFEEAGFTVVYSPTRNDSDHHTVLLPKPVTEDVARRFNTVLGRIR
jgi:hypothetical protein